MGFDRCVTRFVEKQELCTAVTELCPNVFTTFYIYNYKLLSQYCWLWCAVLSLGAEREDVEEQPSCRFSARLPVRQTIRRFIVFSFQLCHDGYSVPAVAPYPSGQRSVSSRAAPLPS